MLEQVCGRLRGLPVPVEAGDTHRDSAHSPRGERTCAHGCVPPSEISTPHALGLACVAFHEAAGCVLTKPNQNPPPPPPSGASGHHNPGFSAPPPHDKYTAPDEPSPRGLTSNPPCSCIPLSTALPSAYLFSVVLSHEAFAYGPELQCCPKILHFAELSALQVYPPSEHSPQWSQLQSLSECLLHVFKYAASAKPLTVKRLASLVRRWGAIFKVERITGGVWEGGRLVVLRTQGTPGCSLRLADCNP